MKVTIFSDGSVLKPNPGGPGGYAAVILVGITDGGRSYNPNHLLATAEGYELSSTNQRMELMAAIAGLEKAKELGAKEVLLVSDSEYVIKGMRDRLPAWIARGWKTASGATPANMPLWLKASYALKGIVVRFEHVRGHRGNPYNELADELAGKQSAKAKRLKAA